jgi:hypothetical protein
MDINGKSAYFRDYLKALDVFLYKESMSLTTGEYMLIMVEMADIREHIEFLEWIELLEIETTYKTVEA